LSTNVTRRVFLANAAAASASLVFAFRLPLRTNSGAETDSKSFAPNAFLEIASNGNVTIWCAKSEVGQGVRTSLPMIVAEELGCDWRRVTVAQADLDPKYGDQLTGGSLSVRTSYADLRKAGAAAREILLTAGAKQWNILPSECRVENGSVLHSPTARRIAFEKLIFAASALTPLADPPLKKSSDFMFVGKFTCCTDMKLKIIGVV